MKSVDEILKCDHSYESHSAVLSCGRMIKLFEYSTLMLSIFCFFTKTN